MSAPRWSGANMRCPTCNKYMPDRCICPKAADMQPAPATEQASGEEIDRQKARAWGKARYGSSDILSKAECDAAMHAAAEGYFAALRATQAERVQSSESRAEREVRKQRIDIKLAVPGATPRERFLFAELERLQSAVIADASDQARRATASKAEAIPDALFDGNSVYAEITRKLGKSHCISADAVSTTLDAVVRLMRADTAVACNAALRAAPAGQHDAAPGVTDTERLGWILDWYLRGASYVEIHPTGHMERTTKEIMLANIDAAIAATTKQGTP